jgi:putative heme-binding domain-containing protein
MQLNFTAPLAELKVVGVRPSRGDFGLPDACILKPGDPYASTLFYRMSKFGRDRMPHLGSERLDEAGLRLIAQWIAGMNGATGETSTVPDNGLPDQILVNPKSALQAARKLGLGELKPAERETLLAAAAKLAPGPVRDLFEGYLPVDEKGGRKLGSNPRPKTILALKGDVSRGEQLFWSMAVNCGSCHKIGDRGTEVGPDLTTIGKLRPRQDLLESILEPSRRVEPKYATYIAQTVDGRTFTGLVVKRDAKEVVLRDAQNKEVVLAADKLEALRPSAKSLMPDGQMAGLTAQEAADLVEYLATRK